MDGWSAQGGQTLGAYHDKQNPCGSSSGGGVATDLGLAFATLGTETDGSIVSPSERNNIVGIKPTVGLTSRDLVIPITEHQDTVGPMARTVRDAAAILQIIAGKDSNDKYTGAIPDVPDYVAACKLDALKGARLGVPWIAIMAIEERGIEFEIAAFRKSLKVFEDAGAVIVEADFESTMDEIEPLQQTMFRADFPVNIARYFSQLDQNPSGVKDVQDMLEMTQTHTNEGYPDRNTASWERVLEQGWDNTDNERFTKLLDSYKEICEQKGLPGTLEKHNLDAIIMPTTEASTWSAVAGAPMVTVPLGFHPADAAVSWDETHSLVNTGPGVPFGMSFSGSKWSEAKLIGYAYAFEQRTMARQKGVRVVSLPKTEIGAVY
jgi:amidase